MEKKNNNQVKYSVIVPVYNKEKYIYKTIKSILDQTVTDFEIIVVDDGSTDHSAEIVESIHDHRIRIYIKKNGGVSSARNFGIKKANGMFISFLDADDLWLPDYLKTLDYLIDKYPSAGMYCLGYTVKYPDKIEKPKFKGIAANSDGVMDGYIEQATGKWNIACSSSTTVKADILRQMDDWFPEQDKVGEDLDMWLRIGDKCSIAFDSTYHAIYNRATENNARTENKIYYPSQYLKNLRQEIISGKYKDEKLENLCSLYDRKIVVYVFSLICACQKDRAKEILKNWNPGSKFKICKPGLYIALIAPHSVVNFAHWLHLKIF